MNNIIKLTGSYSLFFINFLFQRIFRHNARTKWMVHYTSTIGSPHNISIGKNVEKSFARSGGCYIQAINKVILKDYVLFAPGVKIISANHDKKNHHKHIITQPIVINRNTWIGANAVILPGVEIGENCIVGAGSVVTKSFTGNGLIIAGNPAIVIGQNEV